MCRGVCIGGVEREHHVCIGPGCGEGVYRGCGEGTWCDIQYSPLL